MSDRPERKVGETIRYSSGGSVHTGRIIRLGRYGHVRVDTSPMMVPPAWILDDEPRPSERAA